MIPVDAHACETPIAYLPWTRKIGPDTFTTYKQWASDPRTREAFFGALAEERWNHARSLPGHGPGDKVRADHFRVK